MKIDAFDGKKGIEKQMARSIGMLEMRHKSADHRFAGCWSLIGNVGSIDDIETIVKPSFELYKIYGEKDMVILSSTGSVSYWPLQVNGEDQIIEGKNICTITWRSENTFILSFDRGDGVILKELWMRTGMPSLIQKIFGTDIPVKVINVNRSF